MNFLQVLRFSVKLHPSLDTEGDRTFILTYHVVDATLELTEKVCHKPYSFYEDHEYNILICFKNE